MPLEPEPQGKGEESLSVSVSESVRQSVSEPVPEASPGDSDEAAAEAVGNLAYRKHVNSSFSHAMHVNNLHALHVFFTELSFI